METGKEGSESSDAEEQVTVINRSHSITGIDKRLVYSEGESVEDEQTDEEDSDSEFLVHPILHNLIKSKSAYTMRSNENSNGGESMANGSARRMKASRTVFEMSLSKMMESTEKSILEENEDAIRVFIPDLNVKWPEPDDSKTRSKSGIPKREEEEDEEESDNEESDAEERRRASGSWSAPPNILDRRRSSSLIADCEESAECWSAPETMYDVGDDGDASGNCTEDEEHNDDSDLRRTRRKYRRKEESNEEVGDSQDEDDHSEEIWPSEIVMRRERPAWISNGIQQSVPRTFSVQFGACRDNRNLPSLRPSYSAHASLLEGAEATSGSELNEQERKDVMKRCEWLERGSRMEISQQNTQDIQEYPPYTLYDEEDPNSLGVGMSRSNTGEELGNGQRARRRLPKRPDEEDNASRMQEGEKRQQLYIPLQQKLPDMASNGDPSFSSNLACIETPISPRVFAQSPLGSGRRLPALPVSVSVTLPPLHSSISTLNRMSIPPHKQQQQQQPDPNQLCFFDGLTDSVMMSRSGVEDSYYEEEDGINGNGEERKRRAYFSPENSSGISSCTTSGSLSPTHRVQSTFIPRHNDELLLEIGDAVHVERTCEDLWSYGTNLRTGRTGFFPNCVVCEIDFIDEICTGTLAANNKKVVEASRDTFYLTMLASIEVAHHKGNDVLLQAMNKVLSMCRNREETIVPQTVLMEISFRGIHIIDKKKKNFFQCPSFDFFYSLQNISFCGAHPKQLKYFAFISKHPLLPRFACHVFMSNQSTQPIVESIGRAFKRSYDEYMAFAHPTEDIYLE
ncbi:hypothetical protein WR25_09475 [Diploscapter pachys]|uniref:SH3 domain-containing protein n=1 Tax=Diploscapter pachys TaxID=2018661 RepID=A0A2A2LN10_9BILA|nr:hypothetical protein WR25_09475 [Diploscapter pachys]